MVVNVYTDASYCINTKYAACGYIIIQHKKVVKHEVVLLSDVVNSTYAESFAQYSALMEILMMSGVKHIVVHSDCQPLHHLYTELVGNKMKRFHNLLYGTIQSLRMSGIKVTFSHVKAHANNHYNNKIDKSVRSQLRNLKLVKNK